VIGEVGESEEKEERRRRSLVIKRPNEVFWKF